MSGSRAFLLTSFAWVLLPSAAAQQGVPFLTVEQARDHEGLPALTIVGLSADCSGHGSKRSSDDKCICDSSRPGVGEIGYAGTNCSTSAGISPLAFLRRLCSGSHVYIRNCTSGSLDSHSVLISEVQSQHSHTTSKHGFLSNSKLACSPPMHTLDNRMSATVHGYRTVMHLACLSVSHSISDS